MHIDFPNPFEIEGIWFKGNLHTHTRNSDGDLGPRELIERYVEAGYQFLAITDHNKITLLEDEEDHGLLLIPGEEVGVGLSEAGTDFHFVIVGSDYEWKRPEGVSSKEISPQILIEEVRGKGGEVILCHPYWSQLTVHDMLSFDGYIALEIFNTSCHHSIGKGFSTTHWDDLAARGKFVWGVAVDDAHFHFNEHRPVDICGAWTMVKCQALTRDEILNALRKGMFYSSTGPQIYDLHIDGSEIYVVTSPVTTITFVSNNGRGERWTAIGRDAITEAHYKLRGKESFLRIECMDSYGNFAWTNPMCITWDT